MHRVSFVFTEQSMIRMKWGWSNNLTCGQSKKGKYNDIKLNLNINGFILSVRDIFSSSLPCFDTWHPVSLNFSPASTFAPICFQWFCFRSSKPFFIGVVFRERVFYLWLLYCIMHICFQLSWFPFLFPWIFLI